MKNEILIKLGKEILKSYLHLCTSDEKLMFNRMYSHDNLDRNIEDVVDQLDPSKIDHAITQCQNTIKHGNRPYIINIESVNTHYGYNPKFGDDRECVCGHPYYRHFDTYENMYPIGCKYCGCSEFIELTDENREEIKVQKLTHSRFEVIEQFPKSSWSIGDIIETDGDQYWVNELEQFPKIYKKLNWYDKRTEDEMPMYVKFVWYDIIDEFHKVKEWIHGHTYTEQKNKQGEITAFIGEHNTHQTSLNGWLPATEKEYLEFINKKTNE